MHNSAPPLQQIARLRTARIYLGQNQPNQALDLLPKINDFTFNTLIENIKGDIYAAIGLRQPLKNPMKQYKIE